MSKLEVDKVTPQSGTTLTIGEAGDTTVINGLGTLPATIGSATQVLSVNAGATGLEYGTAATDLSNLNATNLTSGTIPDGRFPSILPAAGAQNLTSLQPAAIVGGTFGSINSANLTNLNATALTSGTVATARLGTGTADATTFLRGDQTYASAAGGLQSVQFFSSSTTYTRPAGISKIRVYITGGGGAGGNGDSSVFWSAAGAGGAGGTAIELIDASSMTTVAVTIGAGAIRGGANSGTSSFGSFCSATGGQNGGNTNGPTNTLGGYGIGGDINLYGQGGGGSFAPTTNTQGVFGGSSYWGGGAGGIYSQNGINGHHGGGGSGGNVVGSGGGNGGSGICYIEEYA